MALIKRAEAKNPDIPGVLCISHGPLAGALIESAEMIAGKFENLASLGLEPSDSQESFKADLEAILGELPEETMVLVDIFGGTPCNVLMRLANEKQKPVYAVAGMNLTMLLDVLNSRFGNTLENLFADTVKNVPSYMTNLYEVSKDLI